MPAACCGVYAYRSTSGVLPLEGASTASHSLAAPALIASDPLALLRAGEALRLPGGGRLEVGGTDRGTATGHGGVRTRRKGPIKSQGVHVYAFNPNLNTQ